MEIGTALDVIDVEQAAEVSGSRFAFLKGDAVRLQIASFSSRLPHWPMRKS